MEGRAKPAALGPAETTGVPAVSPRQGPADALPSPSLFAATVPPQPPSDSAASSRRESRRPRAPWGDSNAKREGEALQPDPKPRSKRWKGSKRVGLPEPNGTEAGAAASPPPVPSKNFRLLREQKRFSAAPEGMRDRDLALKCFSDALEDNPNDSFTWHKMGLLYEEEYRDAGKARECFEKAVEVNGRNAPALNSLGLYWKQTDKMRALEYFKRSIAVEPEYGRAHKNLGLLYLYDFKDLTKARESFSECLRVDPNNASAYVTMGQMCESQKEFRAAEQFYDMSIQCDSRNPIGYFRLGVLKLGRRDFRVARQQFELAVRAAPTELRFLTKLAKCLEEEPFKEYIEARRAYRTALAHSPAERVWLEGRIRYIEDKYIPKDDKGNLILPPDGDALHEEDVQHSPLGTSMELRMSSESSDSRHRCPRKHQLYRISNKPPTYKPQATWACEECHKSIGGLDLRVNGAFHCTVCKYDLCSTCANKPKTAHVLPDEPRLIGSGGFGEVFREYDPISESYVAVKYVRTPNSQRAHAVQREVRLMRQFDSSPYIVRVLRMEQERSQTRVYLELMQGSVASQIETGGPVHETQARVWIHDALRGLAQLHTCARPVLHRDLKPENLLLTNDGRVKLSDFGLSKNAEGTIAQTIGPKGTPLYVAPECYLDPPQFTYASDIWGLACSWISMVLGHHPWEGIFDRTARFENIGYRLMLDQSLVPIIPQVFSTEARQLIELMLSRDRRKRPTAEMLLADDYFSRQDLLPHTEPIEAYEHRRDRFLADLREQGNANVITSGVFGSSAIGINFNAPITPVTANSLRHGGGTFPAVDTTAVIAAAQSLPSWNSSDNLPATTMSPTCSTTAAGVASYQPTTVGSQLSTQSTLRSFVGISPAVAATEVKMPTQIPRIGSNLSIRTASRNVASSSGDTPATTTLAPAAVPDCRGQAEEGSGPAAARDGGEAAAVAIPMPLAQEATAASPLIGARTDSISGRNGRGRLLAVALTAGTMFLCLTALTV